MRKLRRIHPGRRQEVLGQLELYLRRLEERLPPQAVALFGSFATGEVHEGSDLDLLVAADSQVPFLERIGLLLELAQGLSLPLQPVGYRPEEVVAVWRSGNRFLQEVVRTGRLLRGSRPEGLAGRGNEEASRQRSMAFWEGEGECRVSGASS